MEDDNQNRTGNNSTSTNPLPGDPVYPQNQPIVQPATGLNDPPSQEQLTEEQKHAKAQLDGDDSVKLKPKKNKRFGRFSGLIGVMQLVIGALVLAFLINNFIFQSYQVFGESMVPTLHEGDRLIISKVSKSWNSLFGDNYQPARGDIVVFESTLNEEVQLVKRVIGVPGDRVVVTQGSIVVFNDEFPDGFNPDDGYNSDLAEYTTGETDVIVGENQIFVSGDNRTPGGSLDSRNDLGLVPLDNVVGELVLRIFPLGDAAVF